MVLIYFRISYYILRYPWMIKLLEMLEAANNIVHLLKEAMKNWNTNLSCSNTDLGAVKINRGTFQGDPLPPLLFVVSFMQLALVVRNRKEYSFFKVKSLTFYECFDVARR